MFDVYATTLAMMMNLAGGSWMVINDDVMGGETTARAVGTMSSLRFEGNLSLANNGGFSSTRRLVGQLPEDVNAVVLRLRGDGRQYQLRLRLDQRFDGVAWRATFDTTGEWQEIRIPLTTFEPVLRGKSVDTSEPALAQNIRQVGFLVADEQEGSFRLDVDRIEFL